MLLRFGQAVDPALAVEENAVRAEDVQVRDILKLQVLCRRKVAPI